MSTWAFGTSPAGLGLTSRQFWAMTHAEFYALKDIWEEGRRFQQSMYAGLQATLHNAYFKPVNGKRFKPSMWLPGVGAAARPDPKLASIIAKAHEWRPATKEETDAVKEQTRIFEDRQRRAQQAKEAGAPREELIAIMNGETYGG